MMNNKFSPIFSEKQLKNVRYHLTNSKPTRWAELLLRSATMGACCEKPGTKNHCLKLASLTGN